jgi:hypothetical protein
MSRRRWTAALLAAVTLSCFGCSLADLDADGDGIVTENDAFLLLDLCFLGGPPDSSSQNPDASAGSTDGSSPTPDAADSGS